MASSRVVVIFCAVLGFGSLGASCGGGNRGASEAAGKTSASVASGPRIDKLPQVDTGELTDAERDLWVELVNDQLSPCGDPISVAKCVSTQNKCGA